ncbi:MAG: PilZ domain-containing protein [Methylomonas sp.]|nr:PilZ domain-containing protein [Methylomonas sp.]
MTHNNSNDDFDELDFAINLSDLSANKRISVRYRRSDLRAGIKIHGLFVSTKLPVELIDISSKGAAITCAKKLRKKAKVTLVLEFPDKNRFAIPAVVVHNSTAPRYGLKFEQYQGELAEHLLETQTDLEFG